MGPRTIRRWPDLDGTSYTARWSGLFRRALFPGRSNISRNAEARSPATKAATSNATTLTALITVKRNAGHGVPCLIWVGPKIPTGSIVDLVVGEKNGSIRAAPTLEISGVTAAPSQKAENIAHARPYTRALRLIGAVECG